MWIILHQDLSIDGGGFIPGPPHPPSLKEILKHVSKLTKRRIGYVHLYPNKILTNKMPLSTLLLKYATSGTQILQSNLD